MQLLLSLFAGIIALNGVNGQPLTQNCGSAQCKFEESASCQQLMRDYVFTGTCCALDPTPSGGCTVSVSAGICYYEPLVPPCSSSGNCQAGAGGKFLGSGNADGCPVTQFDALVGTQAPTDVAVVAATEPPTKAPVVAATPPPTEEDLPIAAEQEPQNTSSASRMGMAAVAVASAFALLL